MGGWKEYTPRNPCPICGHTRWCSISDDGRVINCHHQGGDGSTERTNSRGEPCNFHFVDRSAPRYRAPEPHLALQAERADNASLDTVHRTLLRILPLEPRHRQSLRERGLSDNDIQRLGYRSVPATGLPRIIKHLVDEVGESLVAKTPGFHLANGPYGRFWSLNSGSGIVVPTRTLDCEIVGLKVRLDNPGGSGKFIYLSSAKRGGPGPLSTCHVPIFTKSRSIARLTEGEMKSDIATCLSDILTLGLPGCSAWRTALPILERLQPELILIAFDSDWRHKPAVAQSLCALTKHLKRKGFDVQVEDWCPSDGKGIDDLLVAGKRPQVKPWQYALAARDRGMARRAKKVG
jgi:hypothetical protein